MPGFPDLRQVVLDCTDARALAEFYRRLLGDHPHEKFLSRSCDPALMERAHSGTLPPTLPGEAR